MTIGEAVDAIWACGGDPARFDALMCSSGAEIFYPWRGEHGDLAAADEEYAGHVALVASLSAIAPAFFPIHPRRGHSPSLDCADGPTPLPSIE
uniref:Uncharacterized protein n=1 Tax=Leersia perrieri TaxID=77586 RepID=A0A0D9XQM5_9ORYZ